MIILHKKSSRFITALSIITKREEKTSKNFEIWMNQIKILQIEYFFPNDW